MNSVTPKTVARAVLLVLLLESIALHGHGEAQVARENNGAEVPMEGGWTQVYLECKGTRFSSLEAQRQLYYETGLRKSTYRPHVWKISKDTIEDGRGTKESPIVKHKYERDLGGKTGTIDLILIEKDVKKEKRKLGLYYQIDDFLMIAWNPPGEPRPTSLMTQPKSKTTMVILRRGIVK